MGNSGSRGGGGGGSGSSRGDVCRVDRSHDPSRPCPSGGEGRYSSHEVSFGGRIYSDKGRGDGCYDRTDKNYPTGSSYPSGNSSGKGGEGRGASSGSSGTHRESRSSENTSYTSKQHIDKSVALRKSIDEWNEKAVVFITNGQYKKAIECCDKALQNIGNINNLDISKVEELNKLYLERLEQYKESSAKRDNLYNSSVVNGVNAFSWSAQNPTHGFNWFFENSLKVPSNTPDNIRIINNLNKNLPLYLEEVKRADYFWDQYNNYYQDMVSLKGKLTLVSCVYNIKTEALKKSGDYENALKYCDLALEINPTYITVSNYKNYILREKADFEKAVEYSDNMLRIKPSYQMSNFDYFLKLPCLSTISTINLSNNQIGDDGARILADSLSKGEMPNLKKLHLEGNKITDEGQDALINALKNETVQDVIITAITLYEKYQLNVSGNKEKQRSILENQLERARANGVDVDKVVVDNTTKGWIEHKGGLHGSITFGWAKCFIAYDDIESFAGERLIAKVSKRATVWSDLKDAVLCYFEAEKEVLVTEPGVRDTKYQLEALETSELIGNIEANYDVPPL